MGSNLVRIIKKVWPKISKVFTKYVNVNSISLFIAIVALYQSYCALNESIKQRESMYKPELFIGAVDYDVDISDINNFKFYPTGTDSIKRGQEVRPWYRLDNVGMGSALRVRGLFCFNSQSLMQYFANNGLSDVRRIEGDIIDTISFHGSTIQFFNSGTISDWTVDYVLPVGQTDKNSIQYFPPGLLENAIRAYIWVDSYKENTNIDHVCLPFMLKYKDINDKVYTKELEFSIRVFTNRQDSNIVRCSITVGLPWKDYIKEMSY